MESSEFQTCTEVINRLLLDPNLQNKNSSVALMGFLVHESIFDKYCMKLATHGLIIDNEHIWNYTLCVANQLYSMKLVHVSPRDDNDHEFLNQMVENSKVSLCWDEPVTLYTTMEHFHILKTFIKENDLKKSIKRTYIQKSISFEATDIKVIEFDEHIQNDVVHKFYTAHTSLPDSMYYVTYTLDYLAPKKLEHFNKPFRNPNTLLILYLILDYHRSRKLKKIREVFNIFDLCAMKLAFDDPRYEYENCEFDKLIAKLVKNKKYLTANGFNMKLYAINKAVYKLPDPSVISYFLCTYQSRFDRLEYFENFRGWGKRQNFIKLCEIDEPMNLIRFLQKNTMADIYFIDATNFARWSGELFLQLCEHGARRMRIDTSGVAWEECGELASRDLQFFNEHYVKYLEIIGTNDLYFIENFLNWMKLTMAEHTKYFNISFDDCPIRHPRLVLNELQIGNIELKNCVLTKKLLDALARCHYNDITTFCCKLDNDARVIGGLDNLERSMLITLQEEGHTLELFMQFIGDHMILHGLVEFEFRNKIFIITNAFLDFEEYKFVMNQNRTRLDFFHKTLGHVVDIYAYRFRNNIGEEEDYEFYQ